MKNSYTVWQADEIMKTNLYSLFHQFVMWYTSFWFKLVNTVVEAIALLQWNAGLKLDFQAKRSKIIRDIVFENGPSKICGKYSLQIWRSIVLPPYLWLASPDWLELQVPPKWNICSITPLRSEINDSRRYRQDRETDTPQN